MLANTERGQARDLLARELWKEPYARLLRYGISSYRDITRQDKIGVPVWTACRPLGSQISIMAGKSMNRLQAFAGAIVEAIEFWATETPWGDFVFTSHDDLMRSKAPDAELLPFRDYPLARANLCSPGMNLAWEQMDKLTPGNEPPVKGWVPSDCIWMTQRIHTQFTNFPGNSNGVAGGVRFEDAVLSALYELIERDAWTISSLYIQATGEWPQKVPLVGLPEELEVIVALIRKAGLYPFVFDVTSSVGVPVIGCTLFDPLDNGAGTFGGYGCHLNPVEAAKRALTEACQSRACYISGARDDLFRRDFILLKKLQQSKSIETAEKLPCTETWSASVRKYGIPLFASISEELQSLLAKLRANGITRIYVKILTEEAFGQSKLTVVRCVCPQLEGLKFEGWQSNGRAEAYVRNRITANSKN